MGSTIKRQHSPEFKTTVVLDILKQEETISQICSKYSIHPTQAKMWKAKALEILKNGFSGQSIGGQIKSRDSLIEELYKQTGQLKVELDWLKKSWDLSLAEKRSIIDPGNTDISIRRQCELIGLHRSNLYYEGKPEVSEEDRNVMNAIDRVYTKCPFYGIVRIKEQLNQDGMLVNHKKVQRLMSIN